MGRKVARDVARDMAREIEDDIAEDSADDIEVVMDAPEKGAKRSGSGKSKKKGTAQEPQTRFIERDSGLPDVDSAGPGKFSTTAAQILTLLLSVVIGFAGLSKVFGMEGVRDSFTDYGYPTWMFYAVGVFEVVLALGLLVKKTRVLAGLGVVMVMVGAFVTNAVAGRFDAEDAAAGEAVNYLSFLPVNGVIAVVALFLAWWWADRPDNSTDFIVRVVSWR